MAHSFVERPYWRPDYSAEISSILNQIPLLFDTIKQFVKDPENADFLQGFTEAYRCYYITECNRGEKTGTQTMEETYQALEASRNIPDRSMRKTQNLSDAINCLFHNELIINEFKHDFNVDLAKRIHKIIGKDVIPNAGSYRTSWAKPAQTEYNYLDPALIEEEMEKLFAEVKREIASGDSAWFVVAAKFFQRFLYIHPFSNGNGRTARLLLSALLSKHTVVPVCLFNALYDRVSSNKVYLHCLVEAQNYNNCDLLNSLIIESTHATLHWFLTCLDLY